MFILFVSCLLAITAEVLSEAEGSVRLTGGRLASQGRVEVYLNGQWGTVCDDSWDIRDGLVVCRQLGYTNASMITTGATDGEGQGPINLSGLSCKGDESNLTECAISAIPRHCDHGDDAGVICWPPAIDDQSDGLTSVEIAAIVFIPFLILIITIICIIILMVYLALTYDKDAKDKEELQYQAKRFRVGIKLNVPKPTKITPRRQSSDSYLSERNIPRSALGEGTAHPWQEDDEANSEIEEAEVFIVETAADSLSKGEVRQRVIGAVNPLAVQVRAEMEKEEEKEVTSVPTRYQTKLPVMSDDEIDKQFQLDTDEEYDEEDINPYE